MGKPVEVAAETRADRKRGPSAEEVAQQLGTAGKLRFALAILGVVYGDLGTSAIYSLHAVFTAGAEPLQPDTTNVLGVLSLVFWTLLLVVSLKYMVFVLRADNRGEGGIFALLALLRPWRHLSQRRRHALVLLGLAGAAMLYAGIMITPAISILSAVEGLGVASPLLSDYVVPLTLLVLILLFAVQRLGTARVGVAFGPVMVLWFVAIALLGVWGIVQEPRVLAAVDPRWALRFFAQNGMLAFLVLFAVFLVTTGAEALYADIGHFGRSWIRWGWFAFVLPSLLLNYFGQAAILLHDAAAVQQPFFHLVPRALLYPMVALATLATIIASQAAITGAFSMTRQAARLGLMPPTRVVQTSTEASGQVYVPAMNWLLMVAAIVLVVLFGSSSKLASTYGISVSSTMVVTTLLAFSVARERGHWPLWGALLFLLAFLAVDLTYWGSNVLRIPYGGWFPVAAGALFFCVMSTWRRGLELMADQDAEQVQPVNELIQALAQPQADGTVVARVPGCAIFLTPHRRNTPAALIHHVKRSRALQKQVILLVLLIEDVPRTTGQERAEVDDLGDGFFRVTLRYGYMQHVNVPSELAACSKQGLTIDLAQATYYIEHQAPVTRHGRNDGMAAWRDRLFGVLTRNALDLTMTYQIPTDKIVDIGLRVRI